MLVFTMLIEVIHSKSATKKEKGDLLEKMTKELLQNQGYHVIGNPRFTGMELDLLCEHPIQKQTVYVECKAYRNPKKINSSIIKQLKGAREHKKADAAWLICTCDLGGDAKALIYETENGDDKTKYAFYTPERLISALIQARVIQDPVFFSSETDVFISGSKLKVKDQMLLVSSEGYFWVTILSELGESKALLIRDAYSAKLVKDEGILTKLSKTDTSLATLDFLFVLRSDETITTEKKSFVLNSNYIDSITNLNFPLTHSCGAQATLSDLFVFPDIQNIETDEREKRSSACLADLTEGNGKNVIVGADQSGKTTLGHLLQRRMCQSGLVSIFVDANDIKNTHFIGFKNLLIKNFKKQYSNEDLMVRRFEDALENDRSHVSVIIDDFQLLSDNKSLDWISFLAMLTKEFEKVIIFVPESMKIEILTDVGAQLSFGSFGKYQIIEFGHLLRDELIQKWLLVNYGDVLSDEEINNKKIEIARKVDVFVGTKFIPRYPFYLTSILRVLNHGSQLNIQNTNYAQLYLCFINQSLLAVHVEPDDLEFYHVYLSGFAHKIFSEKTKKCSISRLELFFNEYIERMGIDKKFERVHDRLVNAKILKFEDGEYRFSYDYSYYYYLAKYLADNLNKKEGVWQAVAEIIQGLHRKENANTVMFLVYHSNDDKIIKEITKKTGEFFQDVKPFLLSDSDAENINALINEEVKPMLSDKNAVEKRREALKRQDEIEEKYPENPESESIQTELSFYEKINLSLRAAEILVQIAVNHYGRLDRDEKVSILNGSSKTVFKILRLILEDIETYAATLRKDLDMKGECSEVEKQKIIDQFVYVIEGCFCCAFIKKMGDGMAAKNIFPCLDRLCEIEKSSANELMRLASRLNFPGGLNTGTVEKLYKQLEGGYVSKDVLRMLVIDYIYKFDLDFREKQRICSALSINFKPRMDMLGTRND